MPKLKVGKETVNFSESFDPQSANSKFNVQSRPIRVSPTQSNLVQPNPTTPPPIGKEISKDTVKFLALFDHGLPDQRLLAISCFSHVIKFGESGIRTRTFALVLGLSCLWVLEFSQFIPIRGGTIGQLRVLRGNDEIKLCSDACF